MRRDRTPLLHINYCGLILLHVRSQSVPGRAKFAFPSASSRYPNAFFVLVIVLSTLVYTRSYYCFLSSKLPQMSEMSFIPETFPP
ncbi:hypothetical protein BDR03DRAFT_942522, partial [Suillus americanus]